MKPNKELIKELCFYLGELDYRYKTEAESRRKTVHELLELPYKVKFNRMNYILRNEINKISYE